MIEVQRLRCAFGDLQAVQDVTFEVGAGEIFGLLGPNGAGKTTTIRVLATLLAPGGGRVRVGGHDVVRKPERVRALMGYMPDAWGVYPGLTVGEYLEFFAAAHAVPRRQRERAVEAALELTDLVELRTRRVEGLSKGVRQRLGLARTLIHDPRLLILDEPASGLDPAARVLLRELLRELRDMGKTILISSHVLAELSGLVTQVGIVERGVMLMSGPVEAILARLDGGEGGAGGADGPPARRFTLRTRADRLEAARDALLQRPDVLGAEVVDRDRRAGAGELALRFGGPEDGVAELVRALVLADVPVLELRAERADLEALFLAVTRGRLQ